MTGNGGLLRFHTNAMISSILASYLTVLVKSLKGCSTCCCHTFSAGHCEVLTTIMKLKEFVSAAHYPLTLLQ